MLRRFSLGIGLLIVMASALSIIGSAGAQDTVTLTLNLATCPVTGANSISILESLDEAVRDVGECETGWSSPSEFHLEGSVPDGGDATTSVFFTDLVPGETYLLQEVTGQGVFDDGYSFTVSESDVTLWAVLHVQQPVDEPTEEPADPTEEPTDGTDEESGETATEVVTDDPAEGDDDGDDTVVSSLPSTGNGSTNASTPTVIATGTSLVAVVTVAILAMRLVTRGRRGV